MECLIRIIGTLHFCTKNKKIIRLSLFFFTKWVFLSFCFQLTLWSRTRVFIKTIFRLHSTSVRQIRFIGRSDPVLPVSGRSGSLVVRIRFYQCPADPVHWSFGSGSTSIRQIQFICRSDPVLPVSGRSSSLRFKGILALGMTTDTG